MNTELMDKPNSEVEDTTLSATGSLIDEQLYYVRRPYTNFTREGNPVFKQKRMQDLTLYILKVWISRYITRDNPQSPEWFGATIENNEVVTWFKNDMEASKCEILLDEIKKEGIPIWHHW